VTPLSNLEVQLLRAAFHDGAMRVDGGAFFMLRTNVTFRGGDFVRAFRSLRARNYLKWNGHSVSGGELYALTDEGREAYRSIAGIPAPAG
jgi:hypothetical protein